VSQGACGQKRLLQTLVCLRTWGVAAMPAAVKSVAATSNSANELIRNNTAENYTHKVRPKIFTKTKRQIRGKALISYLSARGWPNYSPRYFDLDFELKKDVPNACHALNFHLAFPQLKILNFRKMTRLHPMYVFS